MKTTIPLLLACLALLSGCDQPAESRGTPPGGYACPMLCVITDQPGECPVCGMEMAPAGSKTSSASRSIELNSLDAERTKIRTAAAIEQVPHVEITLPGRVMPDETRTAVISAWADGRIDRLAADATGIRIQKGEPLAELYSPPLISAQQELILAARFNDEQMIALLHEKLRRLGIDEQQIKQIEQQSEPSERLTIRAPAAGTVLMRKVAEGDYVKQGQPLFRIADLSAVWIELDAYETDLPNLRTGQRVMIQPGGLHGSIEFIDPVIDPKTRTAGVRVSAANPDGALRPEMLVRGTVHVTSDSPAVLVPASAPLITGERAIVYVETAENIYEGREVELGVRAGDQIVVKSGLFAGETVVVNGTFRIDAAMQISGRPSMMNPNPASDEQPAPMQHMHKH